MDKTWLLPVILTLSLNVCAVIITYVLFKKLHSTAAVEGGESPQHISKWKAGGALAGFVIVLLMQIALLKWLIPRPEQPHPESYEAVAKFYINVQARNYEAAWEGLTPNFRARVWSNNFPQFEAGYKNTRSLNLLAISLVTAQSDYAHDYVAYYQDETRAPTLGNFGSIADWKLARLPELLNTVTNIRNAMNTRGLPTEALDNMKMAQFISPKRGDKLRWYLSEKHGVHDFGGLFGEDRKVISIVGQIVRVQRIGRIWSIEAIDGLPFDKEE